MQQHTLKSIPNVVTILWNIKLYFTINPSKYKAKIKPYDKKTMQHSFMSFYVHNEMWMGLMQELKGTLWQEQ